MHHKQPTAALAASLLVSIGISSVMSCTDDRYDLTKDMSVDINVDVSLPVGNSEFIAIGDFLEIGTSGGNTVTTDENGNYVIRFDGGNPVSINVPVPSFEFEGQTLEKIESGFIVPSGFVGMDPSQIQGDTNLEFQILANGNEVPSMEMIIDAELPAEVIDLRCADVTSTIDFTFAIESGSLTLQKGLVITFPDFLTLEPGAMSNDIIVNGGHVVTLLEDVAIRKEAKNASFEMYITHIDLEKVPDHGIVQEGAVRRLVLNDHVTIEGAVEIDLKDFNPVPSMVKMSMYIEMKTADVKRIEAKLNISEEFASQSIAFTDIPDFLSGDNVRLDLWNPVIWLDIDNNTQFEAELNADLRAVSGNTQKTEIHIGADGPADNRTEPVVIPQGKGMIYISRQGYSSGVSGATDIVAPGLSALFETIPDTVLIENMGVTTDPDTFVSVETGVTGDLNAVSAKYGLDAPLAFGREMSLLYSTDIKGWNSAFTEEGDVTIGIERIDIDFTLKNTIPLNVELDAVPVDINGDEIMSGIEVSMDGAAEAGTEESPAYTPVKITLTADAAAIKALDGIRLSIYLTGSDKDGIEGQVLNERHGIQMLGMSAKVAGTVSATLSSAGNDEEND